MVKAIVIQGLFYL